MSTRYLTTNQMAERFQTAESTIRHWRSVGYGPRPAKIGRRFLYPLADVEAWEQAKLADGGAA